MRAWLICVSILIVAAGCNDGKKYHDKNPKSEEKIETASVLTDNPYDQAVLFQKKLNKEFADPKSSPLKKKDLAGFKTLSFFPIDTSFSVNAKFRRTPNEQPILMPTNTERMSQEVLYGVVSFEIHGKKFELNVYQNLLLRETEEFKDYLFLPFADLTNGEQTYGGGRYIDLSIPDKDSIIINFNTAYNPYCAYNAKYSCPLVPKENHLDYSIEAGVKKFE